MYKILVLLSTYNGHAFLREQLDSIFAQKNVDVSILVRDDGSKDATISILEEYAKATGKIDIIKGINVGSAKSFLLLQDAALRYTADFYAFCDQDDVWLDDKLITAINILESYKDVDKPALYMSAFQMVDSALVKIPTPIINPRLTLASALINNCATGCTMVFNRPMLSSVACTTGDNIIMHDYWMYIVCLALDGFVYYDTTPHILYRQHGRNVIGGIPDRFLHKWKIRFFKLFKSGDCYKSKLANKLLLAKGNLITREKADYLHYASTCNEWHSKWKMLTNRDNFSNSLDKNLQIIGLILTGKF